MHLALRLPFFFHINMLMYGRVYYTKYTVKYNVNLLQIIIARFIFIFFQISRKSAIGYNNVDK